MNAQGSARLVVVVGWCLLLLPALSWAQATSGTIAGVVKDPSGAVMPGVTVEAASPALIEKSRTVVSDSQGLYRIVDLRPGAYTVTFTLAGFSTFKRDGIELTTGFTATVNGEMPVGAVEETVTVTSAAPMVDIQNVRSQTVTKSFQLGRAHVQGQFDIYNLLNDDTILNENTRYGGSWLIPTQVLAARLFKFGAQVDF